MESTAPKPFVFVLMPFGPEFDDVYQLGIKAACQEAGTYCERLDEQIFHENMLERIYNQISKADILVADMSGRNPNVFYEVGYAHALGKRVILLTNSSEDIPFDLKQYQHIVYANIVGLKESLCDNVGKILSSKDALLIRKTKFDFFINGCLIKPGIKIKIDTGVTSNYFRLMVKINNVSKRLVDGDYNKIALSFPVALKYEAKGLWLDAPHIETDSSNLLYIKLPKCFMPNEWIQHTFGLKMIFPDELKKGDSIEGAFVCYSEASTEHIPFTLVFSGSKLDNLQGTS
jgi:hypothetical protein